MNAAVPLPTADAVRARLRVMIVDDAVVVRGMFSRWIAAEPDLEVVASLRSGVEALRELPRLKPDVVVLDVEMPDLDGIAALPRLLQLRRDLVVIMASTLTRRNAAISLRALALGAADYIAKPTPQDEVQDFRRELVEKIRQLGRRGRTRQLPKTAASPRPPAAVSLRPMPALSPRALLIGASTGGPQALETILANMPEVLARVPVLITQHMPPTFTAIFSEYLARELNVPVHEAKDGEPVNAGTVYLAPGGRHMRVFNPDGTARIALDNGPAINFCKPAVDPLFTSAISVWGPRCLALVLTGMGHDGLAGARELVAAGGHVMAQDEATSVVWGMPGQVAQAGLCSAVLPLSEIAPRLNRLFVGERP
jgi:two-component system chemotaxis response regulator CheB